MRCRAVGPLAALAVAAAACGVAPGGSGDERAGGAVVAEAQATWHVFDAEVRVLSQADRDRMHASWREGCPVPLDDLRLVVADHWDETGSERAGELVVHADHASGIVGVLDALFRARFPIARMELIDEYGGDDDASMAANNTSAFNCREVAGSPGVWSEHAYGRAIDLNPVQNPYVATDGTVQPPAGADYTDRSREDPRMIRPDGPVVAAFRAIGWSWGGDWSGAKDYQHFSATGR